MLIVRSAFASSVTSRAVQVFLIEKSKTWTLSLLQTRLRGIDEGLYLDGANGVTIRVDA